jgi:hypothetical protein
MAGTLITDSLEQLQEQRKGFIQISLTDFDLTSVSQIALGSRIEISGSVIKFIANESMGTNWAAMSAGIVYAYINGTTYVSTYTETAPVWNTEKQGWYDATGAHRYYAKLVKDAGSLYTQKTLYSNIKNVMYTNDGLANITLIHGSSYGQNITLNAIFDALDPYIPSIGNSIVVSGGCVAGIVAWIASHAYRTSLTVISLYCINLDVLSNNFLTITNGDAATLDHVCLSW